MHKTETSENEYLNWSTVKTVEFLSVTGNTEQILS